jgi:hypothetical protein
VNDLDLTLVDFYGIRDRVNTLKKITVEVPAEVLEAAMAEGAGVADTVREALAALARRRAYDRLLAMEGKLDLEIDLEELRKDKDEE